MGDKGGNQAQQVGVVKYSPTKLPLSSLIVSEYANAKGVKWVVKKDAEDSELTAVPSGDVLKGDHTIARFIARVHAPHLYGSDALSATKIDSWIDVASHLKREQKVEEFADMLNGYLQLRTFIVDYTPSLADIFVYSALRSSPKWSELGEAKAKTLPHLFRWVKHLEHLFKETVKTHLASDNAAPVEQVKTKGRAGHQGSYDALPGAVHDGSLCTRFPPEPSGFLHIGHIKAAMLNNFYATSYKGRLLLRFDDTNPAKEDGDFVENIMQDLKTLEIAAVATSYTSDWFDTLLQWGEKLITSGKAYVDTTPQEQMRIERGDMVESKCRNNTLAENLRLWGEMKKGSEEGQKCLLRAKIDMKSANGVMRDPGMYRCVTESHYRTGTKYKAYPMYDFACPIVDSLEGVTHALRSSEYRDRNPLYDWVCDALNLRRPYIADFSRLNFEYVLLSKRKLQWFVNEKLVDGWDDPRMPTVQGVLRRGLTVEAMREFILAQGASQALNLMNMDKLWAINKKILDPIVPRYTSIDIDTKIPFTIKNGPIATEMKTVPRHAKNPSLGNKSVTYTSRVFLEGVDALAIREGEEITLMNWGNAIVRKLVHDNGKLIGLEGELHLEGDVKSTDKKLTWLADTPELLHLTLREYGYLITVPKLAEGQDFKQYVNHNSLKEIQALGDSNLRLLNKGDHIQLERKGYYIVDSPFVYPNKSIVLVQIPDGKPKDKPEDKKDTKDAAADAKKGGKQQKQAPKKK